MDPKNCKQVVYIGWQLKNTARVCQNSVAVGCATRISVTKKYKCWALPVVIIQLSFEEWRWCCGLKRGWFPPHQAPIPWADVIPQIPSVGYFSAWGGGGSARAIAGQAWAGQESVSHGVPDGRTKVSPSNSGIPWHCLPSVLLCSSCSRAALSPEIFAFRTSSLAVVSHFWLE